MQKDKPPGAGLRVGLFVTCLVDLMRPSVGFAAVKLLEDAGCKVIVPAQTCCGQPAFNSGDRADAKALARQTMRAFADCDYVVAPSGSCARHARQALSRTVRRRARRSRARRSPSPANAASSSASWSTRSASTRVDGALRRRRRPITIPARGCANSACATQPRKLLGERRGPAAGRVGGRRRLLRLRRHVRRQIRRIFRRHRRQEERQDRRDARPTPCSPAISAA